MERVPSASRKPNLTQQQAHTYTVNKWNCMCEAYKHAGYMAAIKNLAEYISGSLEMDWEYQIYEEY